MSSVFDFLRKQPQQSRSRHLVSSVLQAAEELLGKVGAPDQLSVEAVARRAGVGIGSLYDYFSNRDALLGALLARVTEDNFKALEQKVRGTQGSTFKDVLPALIDATFETYQARPAATRAIVTTIARLGWMGPVVKERDRFASVLARRLRVDYPLPSDAELQRAAEVACDAVTSVAISELWRTRSPEENAAIRGELCTFIELRLVALKR